MSTKLKLPFMLFPGDRVIIEEVEKEVGAVTTHYKNRQRFFAVHLTDGTWVKLFARNRIEVLTKEK